MSEGAHVEGRRWRGLALAIAASRRLARQPSLFLVTLLFGLGHVVVVAGAANAGRGVGASWSPTRVALVSIALSVSLRVHTGLVIGSRGVRAGRGTWWVGPRLAAIGAIEGALSVAVVGAEGALVRAGGAGPVHGVVLAVIVAPLVLHLVTRGWLGLVVARVVLRGEALVTAVRCSAALLEGRRAASIGSRAWLSLPWALAGAACLDFGVVSVARDDRAMHDALEAVLLAWLLAAPVVVTLDALCELEWHERLHPELDAQALAAVFD